MSTLNGGWILPQIFRIKGLGAFCFRKCRQKVLRAVILLKLSEARKVRREKLDWTDEAESEKQANSATLAE